MELTLGSGAAPPPERHRAALARAYRTACIEELLALKPGNVGRGRPAKGMTTGLFRLSAWVSARALVDDTRSLGQRIEAAAREVQRAADCNTILGILLLAAPMLEAGRASTTLDRAGRLRPLHPAHAVEELRRGFSRAVERGTVDDAEAVSAAIRVAQPGGIGQTEQYDVHTPATLPLRALMSEAADWDRIARAYADDAVEIFECALPAFQAAHRVWSRAWATTHAYLCLLSADRDSHVARRHGLEAADALRAEASDHYNRIEALRRQWDEGLIPETSETEHAIASLQEWDAQLRDRGINPGTCADLTVTALIAERLQRSATDD